MENLKEGMKISSYSEGGGNYFVRIFYFGIYLLLGIPLYQISIILLKQLISYLNISSDFLTLIIIYGNTFLVFFLLPFVFILFQWNLKTPGVFYFKNRLIILRDEKEGEIGIPLQMVKRILLIHNDSVIIKYHEGFLDELELPRDEKPTPLGEFSFTIDKKSIKIGPSLVDELNKKLN